MARKKHRGKKVEQAAEQFSLSLSDPVSSFAAWILGTTDSETESVTPYTVWGLSAVLRSVSVISQTIAGLPLRTFERQGDDRVRLPSVFDDPYPGDEGQVPFAWVETILLHLLLWRNAYLWHDAVDADGNPTVYRPVLPDLIELRVENRKKRFYYKDAETNETKSVGTEMVTHIPGPSLDGATGHPLLWAARRIFQAALAGDKSAATALSGGIRLGGLITPGEGEDIDPTEGEQILENLRPKLLGPSNAGGIAFINRRLNLEKWVPTNVESQWHETRQEVLGEIGRLFGMPPHLLNDTEKQTSWGTGVAEQNLGLQRFTLKGWSDRIEQTLGRKLPRDQFVEFDYKGLLQGTPAEEIRLVIEQLQAGLISLEFACRVLNLPAPTSAQKAVANPPAPSPLPVPKEAVA